MTDDDSTVLPIDAEPETPTHAVTALVLGPHIEAVSGVSTHMRVLLGSRLTERYTLVHFQVGSEGRAENRAARLARLLMSPFKLGAAIHRHGARLVHLNTSLDARAFSRDLVYALVAKLCRASVVYQVHGGAAPERFLAHNAAARALFRGLLGLADTIVVLSRAELEAYRRIGPRAPVALAPNAIDCRPFVGCGCARSNPEEPLRLVYVGRIAIQKGLRQLLDGLALATRRGAPAHLSIAGSGPDEALLRTYAASHGLDNVAFLGPVHGLEKARLLGRADVFALPSQAEGLPYALLEAMAAGTPALATPVGAIPEAVIDGVHGWLVPVGDSEALAAAIMTLAADREALAGASEACRRRAVQMYSADRLAADLGRVYSSLLEPETARARTRA